MKALSLLLALLVAAPCMAQQLEPPYPVRSGERVRVFLVPDDRMNGVAGVPYVGTVRSSDTDSLTLALSGTSPPAQRVLAWPDIARVDRATQNHTGEALGLLVGGVGGTLTGYALDKALTDGDLSGLSGIIFGGLGGLLVGGIIGSKIGDRWEVVSPVGTASALRVLIPLR